LPPLLPTQEDQNRNGNDGDYCCADIAVAPFAVLSNTTAHTGIVVVVVVVSIAYQVIGIGSGANREAVAPILLVGCFVSVLAVFVVVEYFLGLLATAAVDLGAVALLPIGCFVVVVVVERFLGLLATVAGIAFVTFGILAVIASASARPVVFFGVCVCILGRRRRRCAVAAAAAASLVFFTLGRRRQPAVGSPVTAALVGLCRLGVVGAIAGTRVHAQSSLSLSVPPTRCLDRFGFFFTAVAPVVVVVVVVAVVVAATIEDVVVLFVVVATKDVAVLFVVVVACLSHCQISLPSPIVFPGTDPLLLLLVYLLFSAQQ